MDGKAIVRDGETGEAVVAGTDVTVAEILRELSRGAGVAAVLERYPELTRDAVEGAVSFAVAAVAHSGGLGPGNPRGAAFAASIQSATVVLDAYEYEELLERVELLQELCEAQLGVGAGDTVSHEEAAAYLRASFGG